MKKFLALVLALVLALAIASPIVSAEAALSDDVVILYTNDVHTYIDGALSYDVIAAVKKELQKQYKYVILADAGDHIQGTAYGSMDKGETIIKLRDHGKLYSGRGTSTDIIGSSIQAYISAINKIVYEEA